jgi:hypothetical protein
MMPDASWTANKNIRFTRLANWPMKGTSPKWDLRMAVGEPGWLKQLPSRANLGLLTGRVAQNHG